MLFLMGMIKMQTLLLNSRTMNIMDENLLTEMDYTVQLNAITEVVHSITL